MPKFRYVNDTLEKVCPVLSQTKFPKSDVEPDSAYTIRRIYDNWTKGKPTSPHIFDCEFDEETPWGTYDHSEHSDDFAENPIDRTQVLDAVEDARAQYEYESIAVSKEKKRRAFAASKLRQPDDTPPQPTYTKTNVDSNKSGGQ